MDEAAMAKELTRLNASAKGFRSQFVLTRNMLLQALPLYDDGATASQRRTIGKALDKIGPSADKFHDAYQQLIMLDPNERHHHNFYERQQVTGRELNDIIATQTRCLAKWRDHCSSNNSQDKSRATSLQQL
jgi:hypothetical protein